MMKCFLEIEVPVRYDALWFKELRDACKGVDVRWQRAWHHITMAFLDEMPAGVNFRGILTGIWSIIRHPNWRSTKWTLSAPNLVCTSSIFRLHMYLRISKRLFKPFAMILRPRGAKCNQPSNYMSLSAEWPTRQSMSAPYNESPPQSSPHHSPSNSKKSISHHSKAKHLTPPPPLKIFPQFQFKIKSRSTALSFNFGIV